jgi:hypothetical protein
VIATAGPILRASRKFNYMDVAVSKQTGRDRVALGENSGLADFCPRFSPPTSRRLKTFRDTAEKSSLGWQLTEMQVTDRAPPRMSAPR